MAAPYDTHVPARRRVRSPPSRPRGGGAPHPGRISSAPARSSAACSTFHEQAWSGDRLTFRASALGQQASGLIDVLDDSVRIEVTLPWLLGKIAEKLIPAIRRESTLMLEKK